MDQTFSERFNATPVPTHNLELVRPYELFQELVSILDKAVEKHGGSDDVKRAAELAYKRLQRPKALVAHALVGGGNTSVPGADPTVGEQRVRINFNTSSELIVDELKLKTAELIDLCEALKDCDPRLASIAQTSYEEAAMWAVKAATAPKKSV
jgi:hypothetical protein